MATSKPVREYFTCELDFRRSGLYEHRTFGRINIPKRIALELPHLRVPRDPVPRVHRRSGAEPPRPVGLRVQLRGELDQHRQQQHESNHSLLLQRGHSTPSSSHATRYASSESLRHHRHWHWTVCCCITRMLWPKFDAHGTEAERSGWSEHPRALWGSVALYRGIFSGAGLSITHCQCFQTW